MSLPAFVWKSRDICHVSLFPLEDPLDSDGSMKRKLYHSFPATLKIEPLPIPVFMYRQRAGSPSIRQSWSADVEALSCARW